MPYTMRQVIDRARYPLNDADKVRYADAVLLAYANDAILIMRKKRPDLFIGRYLALPYELDIDADLPVIDEYVPAIADYVTGRAETLDDEHVNSGRSEKLITAFVAEILA